MRKGLMVALRVVVLTLVIKLLVCCILVGHQHDSGAAGYRLVLSEAVLTF